MKRKRTSTLFTLILVITISIIGLTGCNASTNEEDNSNTPDSPNPTSVADNIATPTNPPTPSPTIEPTETAENDETENQDNTNTEDTQPDTTDSISESDEVYYGEWVVNQVLAYGSVGTYSIEEAESLLNKTLKFSADEASSFGEQPSDIEKTVTNPVYTKSDITLDDFLATYRTTIEKLGLQGDFVTQINVSDSEGNGCNFFIKDDNTLIIYGGNTYFELVRKAE